MKSFSPKPGIKLFYTDREEDQVNAFLDLLYPSYLEHCRLMHADGVSEEVFLHLAAIRFGLSFPDFDFPEFDFPGFEEEE